MSGKITRGELSLELNTEIDSIKSEQINAISASESSVDPNTTTLSYILTSHANSPDSGSYWHVLTLFYATRISNRSQIAVSYLNSPGARMLYRQCYNDVWTPWAEDFNQNNYGKIIAITLPATLTSLHVNKTVLCNSTGVVTVPDHSEDMPIGTQITFINNGVVTTTFAPAVGVTISSKDNKRSIDGSYASATLIKADYNVWFLIGALK